MFKEWFTFISCWWVSTAVQRYEPRSPVSQLDTRSTTLESLSGIFPCKISRQHFSQGTRVVNVQTKSTILKELHTITVFSPDVHDSQTRLEQQGQLKCGLDSQTWYQQVSSLVNCWGFGGSLLMISFYMWGQGLSDLLISYKDTKQGNISDILEKLR